MGAGRHDFPPLQAGLDAQASGGNAHQAFAMAVGLLLDKVGQLDGGSARVASAPPMACG